ncbi:MAG: GyrI-like domain-containing protein [Spirochaetaceae bacterium]|nr:GyrI-like domain-containing protein [Spirochaetaceae bacterium]
MEIIDLKKQYKFLYQPPAGKIEIIQVPALQFAMIDGAIEKGSEPGLSQGFSEATQALYSLSYTLKFMMKKLKHNPADYPVMALEGLWWVEDGRFDIAVKDNWSYTLMIMQPEIVTGVEFEMARDQVRKKKGDSNALRLARLVHFDEGLCVQATHVGPYSTEPDTIQRMCDFIAEKGLKDAVGSGGKHHEIYLSDPRRAAPEKMKTVLRHPVFQG